MGDVIKLQEGRPVKRKRWRDGGKNKIEQTASVLQPPTTP
jgi:hypothetical protein